MQIKKRIKIISISPAIKREIANIVGCCMDTVENAVTYRTSGEQPDRIRQMALDRGGVDTYIIKWVEVNENTIY